MNVAIPCVRCGKVLAIAGQLGGRKIRCQTCGQIQCLPTSPTRPPGNDAQQVLDVYSLAPDSPAPMPVSTPGLQGSMRNKGAKTVRPSRGTDWGSGVLWVSCLATAAVVVHGLRLLWGHADNGAPLQ